MPEIGQGDKILQDRLTADRAATLDKTGRVWEYKNVDFINESLVVNEWMTPLDTVEDVKVWYLAVEQTNNSATSETIAIELTINGTVHTSSLARNSGAITYYYMDKSGTIQPSATAYTLGSLDVDHAVPLETKSIKIRVKQATSVDAVSAQIEVNIVYAQLEAT